MAVLIPAPGSVIVVVMDGVGVGDGGEGDAVARAQTPMLDWLGTLHSYRTLLAHGSVVGMPSDKHMGNSSDSTYARKRPKDAYPRVRGC